MDKKILVADLQKIFCETNRKDRKYAEVWLSDADFGGIYSNNKFLLNIKCEHSIGNCTSEINEIVDVLQKDAPHTLEYIWGINLYTMDDQVHCTSEDILVYAEELACK